jgi:hypothetical protein
MKIGSYLLADIGNEGAKEMWETQKSGTQGVYDGHYYI